MAKVIVQPNKAQEYALTAEDLVAGCFYEHSSGKIVLAISDKSFEFKDETDPVVCIGTGIGSFYNGTYKLITSSQIVIVVNEKGGMLV